MSSYGAARRKSGGSLRSRLLLLGAAIVAVVVVLLAVAQLVLPGLAAQRLRDRLSRSGTVQKVAVDAFPAIELLWHHADRVVIRMGTYRTTPGGLSSTLTQVGDTDSLDATADTLQTGLLTLHHATLTKRGDGLRATATVTEADLRASFPVLESVQPVASSGGQLTLQGTATALGATATVNVTVTPRDGALVAAPDVPFGSFATITLFDNPVIAVQGVAAAFAPGGFALSAQGRLR